MRTPETVDVAVADVARQFVITVRLTGVRWWMLRVRLGAALIRLGARFACVTLREERRDGPE